MDHAVYSPAYVQEILTQTRSVAILGASSNPARASYGVAQFWRDKGRTITPINPGMAGQSLLGAPVVATLADLQAPVDMIDVFRSLDAIPGIAAEILVLPWRPKTVWLQLDLYDEQSAAKLEAVGIQVVMNRCPKIEWPRAMP